ncbi:MAG: DNA polymerase I, partial [Thermoanaerobaculia bacterium]
MPELPILALIDASGYLYRAFHAIRGLSGPGGRPTNAVYGFAMMLRKLRADRNPGAMAVCFDRKERTFRHDMDVNYKAQRQAMPDELVPQIEDAKALCRALGLSVVEEPGWEADDLIAALAERASRAGLRVEIASADKDLFQLVEDDRIVIWHPTQERVLNAEGVKEFFGVPPERVVDVLALMGDASDNIPGVAGIGEKGARELVLAFGSLDEIYAHLADVKGKRRDCLVAGRESAFQSRELVKLRRDAPVGLIEDGSSGFLARFQVCLPDREALALLYDLFGFAKLKRELTEAEQPILQASPSPTDSPSGSSGVPATLATSVAPATLATVLDEPATWLTPDELPAFLERARRAGRVGLFVESLPMRPYPPRPLIAAAAFPDADTVVFSVEDPAGRAALEAILTDPELVVVAHDSKRLHLAASLLSIEPTATLEDSMLSSYVVSPGLHAHDLAGDARGVLNRAPDSISSLRDVFGAAGFASAADFSSDAALRYLAGRARLPLQIAQALEEKLTTGSGPALRKILRDIELPLVPVLSRMERAGIAVDRAVLAEMSVDFAKRLDTLERAIHQHAGEPFNVGSPTQLGRILFEKLGYPVLKKTTKTKSYATDSDVLGELVSRDLGPLPALVLEWRELSKLKGTYVDALPEHLAEDGRIHTRYDQAVAATGRLSSNDPNLQNIPIRSEAGRLIRRAFVAPEGFVLIAADYSQIELRLLAHLSEDEALVQVFQDGEDIHRATAARIFGIDPLLVSHDQRRGAKTINFGILYGMGPFALAAQLGVPQAEAKLFIKAYFERFPKIRACLDAILQGARESGCTETIFGRLRPIPGLSDRNHAVRANAERMAMNAPFQGAAADLIKRAMVQLDARLRAEEPRARLLLQVHDELVIEAPQEDAARVVA